MRASVAFWAGSRFPCRHELKLWCLGPHLRNSIGLLRNWALPPGILFFRRAPTLFILVKTAIRSKTAYQFSVRAGSGELHPQLIQFHLIAIKTSLLEGCSLEHWAS